MIYPIGNLLHEAYNQMKEEQRLYGPDLKDKASYYTSHKAQVKSKKKRGRK